MTQEELAYLVRVNDRDLRELKRNIDTVNKAADEDLGRASNKADSHLRKINTAATVAAVGVGGVLVVGMKKSVDAAIDSQRVQKATEVQLRALGVSYRDHAAQINKVVTSTSQLAALDDEDLQQSFTRLVPATHNVNKALQQMQLAADIARARNISLESATNLVVRANTGSAGALRRLGITLVATNDHVAVARRALADYKKTHDALSPAMEKHFRDQIAAAAAADKQAQAVKNLDVLQHTFAGSAKSYGESAAGAQERYAVAVENVQEAIGGGLLPALTLLLNEGSKVLGWTQNHTKAVGIAIAAVGGLAAAVLIVNAAVKAWTALQVVARAATVLWTGAQWLLNAALSANPIALVVLALAGLAAAFVVAWQHSETFRRIVVAGWNDVKAGAHAVASFVTTTIPNAFETVLAWLRRNWPIIATIVAGPFAPMVALATNAFGIRSALLGAFGEIRERASGLVEGIVGFFEGLPKRLTKAIAGIVDEFGPLRRAFELLGDGIGKVVDGLKWILGKADDVGGVLGKLGGAAKAVGGILSHVGIGDGIATVGAGGGVVVPGGGGFPASISSGLYDDIALGQALGLSITSGYRPGSITSTGNVSLHSLYPAKAVDLGGSEAAMRQFFGSEIGRPGIAELIHSPYWWHPGSGVEFIPATAGSVLADHYNHVHVGIYDRGGYLPPGLTLAVNMTGRPERVVGPHQDAPLVSIGHVTVRNETDVQLIASAVNRALGVR